MPRWLKVSLLSVVALVLVLGGGGYFYGKSIGIIPSHDYETAPPTVPAFTRPAVLIFNKTNGFVHKDAIPVAHVVVAALALAMIAAPALTIQRSNTLPEGAPLAAMLTTAPPW